MSEKTRLKVALDMLIEYLLQQNQTEYTANGDQQQCESNGFGSCAASPLTVNTGDSLLVAGN